MSRKLISRWAHLFGWAVPVEYSGQVRRDFRFDPGDLLGQGAAQGVAGGWL